MSEPLGHLAAALASRYVIEREIGAGGMATVYLARDLRHERHVAVKVLNPELGAVLGAERFLAEIKTTANLQHPHLLPLFDSGQTDGLLYYVMPYVEGGVCAPDSIARNNCRSTRRFALRPPSAERWRTRTNATSFIAISNRRTSCCTQGNR
jgi:serine/threonine protein kinase